MKTKITILFLLAICSLNLFSTNFTVTNNGDGATANSGTLRDVITRANADASTPHTITFGGSYTITLGSALPTVGKTTTIDGGANTIEVNTASSANMLLNSAGVSLTLKNITFNRAILSASGPLTATGCTFKNANPAAVKVSGVTFTATSCTFDSNTGGAGQGSAITTIASGSIVSLTSCKITNNSSTGGAAVYVQGNNAASKLEMINCIVSGNTSTSAANYGGGIASAAATTTITNCAIYNNSGYRGGGIALLAGGSTASSSLTMLGSTVSGNTITGTFGCGIYLQGVTNNYTGNCIFTNCTISGNYTSVASSAGGGVEIGGGGNSSWAPTITFTNCTITGNYVQGNPTSNVAGGGVDKANGTVVLNYCIVAGNNSNSSSASRDLGSVTSTTGRNLYGGTPSWNSTTTTVNVNLTADISTILNTTLTDNGGTTALPDGSYVKTHALLAGTSLQTAIDPDATGLSGLQTTDQRGTGRDARPDIGAYESMLPGVPTAVTVASNNVSGQLSVTFTAPSVSTKGGAAISNYKYSIDGGTSFTALLTPQTTSPFVISGLTNGTSYNVQIRALNSNGDGVPCVTKTGTPNVATITGAATATAFTTTYGTVSAPQSFSISGANLVGAITATAPTGYEVSSDGTTYAATATYARSLVDFTASGTVYIRLKATATVSGTYNSKNIVLTSSGATPVDITTAASGNTVTAKALTITAQNQTVSYGTAASSVTGAGTYAATGFITGEDATVIGGSISYSTTYTNTTNAGTSGVTITPIVTSLIAGNYSFSAASATITVSKATPSISISGTQNFTYNGSEQGPATVSYSGDGTPSLLYSSTDTQGFSSATAPSNAGTYQVVYSATAGTNYVAASTSAYTFTIYSTGNITSDTNVSSLTLSASSDLSVTAGNTLTIDANTTVNSVTVAPTAKLTLNSGRTLTTGSIILQSSLSGTATFVDKTENGGLTVTGTTTVQQYLSKSRNWYITTPVSLATASVINPQSSSNLLYWYDETKGSPAGWTSVTSNSASLTPGLGYIVKPAADGVTLNFTGGNLNSGTTPSLTVYRTSTPDHAGFNLIGNPYPSYLNARTVINSSTNLDKSIWYRTQINNSTTYKFDTYNTTSGQYINASGNNTYIVGTVPPMQAFWVRVSSGQASASVDFSNSYRTHATADTLNPLKVKSQLASVQPALRLLVSNGINSDETLLYSDPNATNGYDIYDSQKMSNGSSFIPELYTLADNQQLAINGLNQIPYETEMPLGFTTLTSGDFSIRATQIANFQVGTQVILKDYADTNYPVITDLSDGSSYNFNSNITTTNSSRFTLTFRVPSVTTKINPESNSTVWISTLNRQIVVNGITNGAKVEVLNAIGQKVISRNLTGSTIVPITNLVSGAYLVRITLEGKSLTKKVIID